MLTVFKYQWQFNHNVCKVVFNISDNEIHLHNQNALNDALFMEQIYVQKYSTKSGVIISHSECNMVKNTNRNVGIKSFLNTRIKPLASSLLSTSGTCIYMLKIIGNKIN